MTDVVDADGRMLVRGRIRGRYDIVVPLDGPSYLRVTSRPDRSLSIAEIITGLRRLCDELEPAARSTPP